MPRWWPPFSSADRALLYQIAANQGETLRRLTKNQEKTMATLQEVLDAEAQAKAELDTIAAGVTALVASNADLAAQLAAAIAANDPAQLQAALDAANAIVAEGQTIIAALPATAPPTP